jgi:hypothetical protein
MDLIEETQATWSARDNPRPTRLAGGEAGLGRFSRPRPRGACPASASPTRRRCAEWATGRPSAVRASRRLGDRRQPAPASLEGGNVRVAQARNHAPRRGGFAVGQRHPSRRGRARPGVARGGKNCFFLSCLPAPRRPLSGQAALPAGPRRIGCRWPVAPGTSPCANARPKLGASIGFVAVRHARVDRPQGGRCPRTCVPLPPLVAPFDCTGQPAAPRS